MSADECRLSEQNGLAAGKWYLDSTLYDLGKESVGAVHAFCFHNLSSFSHLSQFNYLLSIRVHLYEHERGENRGFKITGL